MIRSKAFSPTFDSDAQQNFFTLPHLAEGDVGQDFKQHRSAFQEPATKLHTKHVSMDMPHSAFFETHFGCTCLPMSFRYFYLRFLALEQRRFGNYVEPCLDLQDLTSLHNLDHLILSLAFPTEIQLVCNWVFSGALPELDVNCGPSTLVTPPIVA